LDGENSRPWGSSDLPELKIDESYLQENLKREPIYEWGHIQAGATYDVKVIVHKPENIRLSAGKWRVGVQFLIHYGHGYSIWDVCFNKGTWEEIESGVWFYTGWREAKIENISWENLAAGEMELIVPVHVVDDPRPDVDIQHGMINISEISYPALEFIVEAYLEIDNVNHHADNNENKVTFEVGDTTFTCPFHHMSSLESVENKMSIFPWRGEELLLTGYGHSINVATDALIIGAMYDSPYIVSTDNASSNLSLLWIVALIVFGALVAITLVVLRRGRK
jgi:hypothetical protein